MSSRSLGLLAGFFVSQGRSLPASCRLMRSGSSVRKRMRPCSRTLSGRFSILRSRSESITLTLPESGIGDGRNEAGGSLTIVTLRRKGGRCSGSCPKKIFEPEGTQRTQRKLSLIIAGHGKGFEAASREDILELVQQ